ncbi:hypothetical protein Syun_001547 [Stephania yunnanensis]|uniref:Uncharacterized protein n=1 Tax=Stephania yunnanensis TaxID=152371 RepID=A0AAP0LDX9_9MAGN
MPVAMTKVVTQPLGTTLTWSIYASRDVAHASLRDKDCSVVLGCAQALRVLAGAWSSLTGSGWPDHGSEGLALTCQDLSTLAKVCLAHAKARPCSCQRMTLLVPRHDLTRAKGICQGIALPVPKELAKARPCSCIGATLLVPKESALLAPKELAKAHAKAQPHLRPGTVPWRAPRRDLLHACALFRMCFCRLISSGKIVDLRDRSILLSRFDHFCMISDHHVEDVCDDDRLLLEVFWKTVIGLHDKHLGYVTKYFKNNILFREIFLGKAFQVAKLQRRRQELTQTTPDQPVDDEAVYYKVAGDHCPQRMCLSLRSLWRKKRRYVDPDASTSQMLAQRGIGNFMILSTPKELLEGVQAME